jgi:hypothetical protein
MKIIKNLTLTALAVFFVSTVQAAEPIQGTSGTYMSPYTSDGVTADWVNKAINADMGSAVGGAVGAYAGAKAMENVPFIGGFLGNKVGKAAGRKAALSASGGERYMRETSDLSFNSLDDLAQWMYLEHGQSANYNDVLEATKSVYPDLAQVYPGAVARAAQGGQSGSTSGSRATAVAAVSSQSQPARAVPMAPVEPPPPWIERGGHAGIALAKNSGDISGIGLLLNMGGISADAKDLGLFYDLGFMASSGDDVDVSEIFIAFGPSYGFSEYARGYVGLQMDAISYSDDYNETADFFGFGYRLGAEFRMPAQNLILDLGVRSVDADDDPYTLDYTGMKASLEYRISDGAGLWLGYEDRDGDNSIYLGVRGRFAL